MDFITIPLTLGIAVFAFYKLVELYVRKKERILIIEKLSQLEKVNVENFNLSSLFGGKNFSVGQFTGLRIGSLLIGLGLGLLIAYFIINMTVVYPRGGDLPWSIRESISIVYGASTLLFGGLGLVTGFIIERKMISKN